LFYNQSKAFFFQGTKDALIDRDHSEYNSYFLQAQRIRRLVVQDFDSVLLNCNETSQETKVHALLTPVSPKALPPVLHASQARAQKAQDYINDLMTIPASLAGLPCVVVPFGKSKIGLQLMTGFGRDFLALRLAQRLEGVS
jgi:aspartyl-tRNA(Asn)/glutamyl-tRNA(Gln) amidotransferase subunit A